ncbi:hypothetical protein DAEQUDRAFT_513279 [Daedalea quercina L-15889]|uniref:F-box domain-containing protein n=1 Tax=Daedalea quercina L-15889 TaxID=1314783 RepID=A0A165MHG3_9APHY|nr:hypothetical protein DAEQUDRAFT_513279 [Daedalea quercina L-15889]
MRGSIVHSVPTIGTVASSAVSDTAPTITGAPRLPFEVWERIIDLIAGNARRHWNLRNSHWWTTLLACALACKTLYSRAQWHLRGNVLLKDRSDVVSLSRLLRANPYPRQAIRFVTIAGMHSYSPIPHLGTFAAMLARYLPNAEILIISNATWRVGSVRPEDIAILATFRSIRELTLEHVNFTNASQFAQVISALPHLASLLVDDLSCLQDTHSLVSLPLNSAGLRDVSMWGYIHPALRDLLYRIGETTELRALTIGVHFSDILSGTVKFPGLLQACITSLRNIGLTLNLDGAFDTRPETIFQLFDLSRHNSLESLRLTAWCSLEDDYLWIPHMLSRLGSFHVTDLKISFHIGRSSRVERLSQLFHRLEARDEPDTEDVLAGIDQCLSSHSRFDSMKSNKLIIGLAFSSTTSNWGTLGVTDAEWAKLVRRKMPRADSRGILRTTVYEVW